MRTTEAELTVLENADEVREFLLAVGVQGPSLHPRANLEDTHRRWNGWNHAVTVGVDARGAGIKFESWHFAAGGVDYSVGMAASNNIGPTLGRTAFDPVAWPVRVFPAIPWIRHPEHTPVSS